MRIGLAFSLGTRARRYCGGTAAMMSTNRGWASSPYLAEVLVFTLVKNREVLLRLEESITVLVCSQECIFVVTRILENKKVKH